ncbi:MULTISPECIES: DUF2515 domain-containing protein [unclassified Bacillus cereus group]|uniref:DUF2515 domain-containing protein n=1 Tax=unclassified Bacillus cereus group TaxID=2750818 RepID=UPI001F5A7B01|nr:MULTISPECIES: DUF2515 domain-containing protein [unclassified Bacillus cereus group]
MNQNKYNFDWNRPSKTIPLSLIAIKNELQKKSQIKAPLPPVSKLTQEEKWMIHYIQEQTKHLNKNNVTRTRAYYQFYVKYPEIQWALLGHMVSRNGGWNMTDLKGDLYTRLLSEKDQFVFFSFLERGNWFIFQDVYPQFLLYEQSLKRSKALFYLLPYLNVSTFMETMWNHFWKTGNRYTLAIATIINEQSYLERRVIQNAHFKKIVLNSVAFKLFDFFRFNHILFPYYEDATHKKTLLLGDTMKHFTSLHERIMLGKRLYTLLFHNKQRLAKIITWAHNHPHTGSRKDYWPHLFSNVNESFYRKLYRRRIKKCQLRKGAHRVYSPELLYAWQNVTHTEAEKGDWFTDWRIVNYLIDKGEPNNGEIMDDYCKTLKKIELAIMAKKNIFLREEEESEA